MSASNTAARLAFHGFDTEGGPAPRLTRSHVDRAASGHRAADIGPSQFHRLHGAISLDPNRELRITTQPARDMTGGKRTRAKMIARIWYRRKGVWWTDTHETGVMVTAANMKTFTRAVGEAARHLAGEVES